MDEREGYVVKNQNPLIMEDQTRGRVKNKVERLSALPMQLGEKRADASFQKKKVGSFVTYL